MLEPQEIVGSLLMVAWRVCTLQHARLSVIRPLRLISQLIYTVCWILAPQSCYSMMDPLCAETMNTGAIKGLHDNLPATYGAATPYSIYLVPRWQRQGLRQCRQLSRMTNTTWTT